MKTTILFALILSLCFSCKPKEGSDEAAAEVEQSPTLIDQMQGEYEGCVPSTYSGFYSEVKVSVIDTIYTRTNTLSANADCSSPYYIFEVSGEIDLATKLSESPLKVAVDIKIISYKFTDLHGWYSTQNYCGLNTWVKDVEKDVTGLNCPNLNTSSAGTQFLSAGDFTYQSIIIGTNAISVVMDDNETGVSDLTRMLTGHVEVPKI